MVRLGLLLVTTIASGCAGTGAPASGNLRPHLVQTDPANIRCRMGTAVYCTASGVGGNRRLSNCQCRPMPAGLSSRPMPGSPRRRG